MTILQISVISGT